MDEALNPTLHRLLRFCRLDRTWVRGEGVWLVDDKGRRFLDCYSQYGAVALGHNAPVVVAAVQAALQEGEPAMVQPYRAPQAVALAAELTRLAPGSLSRCLFTTSGAEAVEAAIKLVRCRTGRPIILSAQGSFHGKTLGALAATGQPRHAEGFGPAPPGFEHVPFGSAESLARRLERDASRVAAVLLEPIQGENGVQLPPPGYLPRVRELCSRYGTALIFDEIQTGLGRTGRLFACELEEVSPDLLLLAKALGGGLFPLGACLVSADFWDERFALRHSSTFANNNVACRVGRAVLDQLTRGRLCEQASQKGERLLTGLERLARRCPGLIAAVRGRGLMTAIELRGAGAGDGSFLSFLHHQGLYAHAIASTLAELASVLVLPTLGNSHVLRVTPPLVITDQEISLALDDIESVFARVERNPEETLARALGVLEECPPAMSGSNGRMERLYLLPPEPQPASPRATYAFLVHLTRPEDVTITNPGLERLSAAELRRFCDHVAGLPPVLVMRAPTIRSPAGSEVEGLILLLPLLPEEMARRGMKQVSQEIERAVDLAAHLGARVVGLGGHTTPFSRRGRAVTGRGPAITTGSALTAGTAFAATHRLLQQRRLGLGELSVAIVGARGSVGGLCARLFARAGARHLVLVGNPAKGANGLQRLQRELEWAAGAVEVLTDLDRLVECQVIITATAAVEPVLDRAPLAPGTIICDVARPSDVSERLRARADLTVFDGGLVALPDPEACFGPGNILRLPRGVQLACLAETILLTLEADSHDHGIGEDVPLEEVDAMLRLAQRHGFRLAPFSGNRQGDESLEIGEEHGCCPCAHTP